MSEQSPFPFGEADGDSPTVPVEGTAAPAEPGVPTGPTPSPAAAYDRPRVRPVSIVMGLIYTAIGVAGVAVVPDAGRRVEALNWLGSLTADDWLIVAACVIGVAVVLASVTAALRAPAAKRRW